MPYRDIEVRRAWQREWMARRRAEYFADKKCVVCGSVDRLELDHIDRREKVSHRIWSWSNARRVAELTKCQTLCHEHHLEKTVAEGPHGTHGTHTMHCRGCRCRPCIDAHTKYDNERRWANGTRHRRVPASSVVI